MERESKAREILLDSISKNETSSKENIIRADIINFNINSDKIIQTDQFGFIRSTPLTTPSKKEMELLKKQTLKWDKILNNYDEYYTTSFQKLKKLTREGIPDSLRGAVWKKFSEVANFHIPGLYAQLLSDKSETALECEKVILKDLDRTFPSHSHFSQQYGEGQRSLFHVLSAYAKYNKATGYVQGMGFLTALLLIYMDEESAFYCLHSIMKKYDLEGLYLDGFPSLKKRFFVLLNLIKKYLPKVYEVMQRFDIAPSIYASEWFITMFTRQLDFNILVRVFDVFFLEGFKVIYRFSIAFLKIKQQDIIKPGNEMSDIMEALRQILMGVSVNEVFDVGYKLYLSRDHIKEIEDEYEKVKDNKTNEFIRLL